MSRGIWRGTVLTVTGSTITYQIPRLAPGRVFTDTYPGLTVGTVLLVGLIEGDPDQPVILRAQ